MNLEDIQDGILGQLHEGEPVDRDALLAAHEEHADALRQFFAVLDVMEAEPEGDEQVPTRLGEFRIVREIGRGGMGIVFEAEQTSLKRRVALKVLPTALRSDRRLLSRFRREAEAAARLRHPNIVPVYSIGQAGNAPFFAMEMVSGQSLAQIVEERREGRDGGLPEELGEYQRRCVEIVIRLAGALSYAHSQGILHRDVKPANVLLEADGTPRLTDFGLAADLEASSLTVSGEVFGSPRYMSPEQAFRCEKPLDARTDVYSLGVTLYEMLTLRLPYRGTTTSELLAALGSGEAMSPRDFGVELPGALERVLMLALRRDLDDRYASAAEFAGDLQAALQGRSEPPRRGRRRARKAAVAIVVGVGTVLLGLELFGSGSRPGNERKDVVEPVHWAQIAALADGTSVAGAELMQRLFRPSVEVRGVLVRNAPYTCRANMNVLGAEAKVSADVAGAIAVVCLLEFSVDGGPWQHPRSCGVELLGHQFLSTGAATYFVTYDPRDYLGDLLQRDSLRLAHRITIRMFEEEGHDVLHGRSIEYRPNRYPFDIETGTVHQWILPDQTVFCFDDYPEDYPERVSDPALRGQMEQACTPKQVAFGPWGSSGMDGVLLEIQYPPGRAARVLPLACEMDLLLAGTDEVIASNSLRLDAERDEGAGHKLIEIGKYLAIHGPPVDHDPAAAASRGLKVVMFLSLPDERSSAQQRFLLDLTAGGLETVRLVFRPSRAVALQEPPLSRYWGDTLEVTVPVSHEPR